MSSSIEANTTPATDYLYNMQNKHAPAPIQQAVLVNGVEYDHADISAPNDSGQDDDHRSSTSTTTAHEENGRTLRRTPRSRRIYPSSPPLESDRRPIHEGPSAGNEQLASTMSNVSVESSETEWEDFEQQSHQKPQEDQTEKKMTQHHGRHTYPLQAPASASNPKESPTVPSSPNESAEDLDRIRQDGQSAPRTINGHRKAYPLQTPASKATLRWSATTPPPMPESKPEQTSTQVQNRVYTQGQKTKKVPHRQAYPLQSPASLGNLQHPPSPPSSPESSSEYVNEALASQRVGDVAEATQRQTAKRQPYPLQAQASVADLQRSSSSTPPPASELDDMRRLDEPEHKAATLAAKVVKHWRRQTYPLQWPDSQLPFDPTATYGDDQRMENVPEPEPVHLPQNMRAASDASKQPQKGRTIVVCLDGTGDKFDNDNSNIVHLVSALKKDDANQVTYYQAGIGTYGEGGLSGGVYAAVDMAVGAGLGLHIRDAYHFLMHTYKEGDRICIFGFSRGAYTARCLAGMVHKVGLLPPRNVQQIPFAYDFYTKDTLEGWRQSRDFKATFCIDVCVYFLGCFDSVASVGFIPRQLPLSSTPDSKPRYFRHAMALDERRAKFKICRHQKTDWKDIHDAANQRSKHSNLSDNEYERLMRNKAPFDTDVLEVWFAGCHGDVGGGAVPNDERHKLAQIPLRWMIRQAFECNTGIVFKTSVLAEFGLDVHTLWPIYRNLSIPSQWPPPSLLDRYEKGLPPKTVRRDKLVPTDRHEQGEQLYHLNSPTDEDWTPEQLEDAFDALCPMSDQLEVSRNWWILEFIPVEYEVPVAPGEIVLRTGMNLGRYRGVEDAQPKVHWTVNHRSRETNYRIQARTAANTTWSPVV